MNRQFEEGPYRNGQILILGPSGEIELLVSYPEGYSGDTPVAVICHPHPLHGGTMTNKVVHILAKAFNKMGLPSIRFNFRGVGKSSGNFDEGQGEKEDLLAVVKWSQQQHPKSKLWLAGFSFGAYVAMCTYAQAGAQRLLLVAPPVERFGSDAITDINIPWMVIQGGEDEVVSPKTVSDWIEKQHNPPQLIWLEEASHFFHGRLNDLQGAVIQAWQDQVQRRF